MSLSSWCGVTPQSLNLPAPPFGDSDDSQDTGLEPSGLTLYQEENGRTWLFVVSDDGRLIKGRLQGDPGKTEWYGPNPTQKQQDKSTDYESVTMADGRLMVGVEGGREDLALPVLKAYQPNPSNPSDVATALSAQWSLPVPDMTSSGMEAMTFIPSASCPASWGAPANGFGGLFIISLQGKPGTAYVFELKGGETSGTLKTTLTLPAPSAHSGSKTPLVSDFFFDRRSGYLWVLYDGGTSHDYLQTVSLQSDGTLAEHKSVEAPDDWVGCEGLAVWGGGDVLIAIDAKDGTNNGVYALNGFASASKLV